MKDIQTPGEKTEKPVDEKPKETVKTTPKATKEYKSMVEISVLPPAYNDKTENGWQTVENFPGMWLYEDACLIINGRKMAA